MTAAHPDALPATPQTARRTLPRLLLLTDRWQLPTGRRLLDTVAAAVDAGLRAVLVRERDLDDQTRTALVDELQALLAPVGGTVVVATPQLGRGTGVHLRASDPPPSGLDRPAVVGRSCHDRDELVRAAAEGCDYVTLSPVAGSASKPGYGPPLGRSGLRDLAGLHPVVYALGGVTAADAGGWLAAGAHGVAVMGAVMRSADPAAATARLLDAVARADVDR